MKTAIIFTLLSVMSFGAMATERTMINYDEEVTGDSKVCFYKGGGNTATLTVEDQEECPYTETFDVD